MKLTIILFSAICWTATVTAEPISLEYFRTLSSKDREKAIQEAPLELKQKFEHEQIKLSLESMMGVERWKSHEEWRAAKARLSLDGLAKIFVQQVRIWDVYFQQTSQSIRSSRVNEADRKAALIKAELEFTAGQSRYSNMALFELPELANTPEELELDSKAKSVAGDLEKQFPYGSEGTITRENVNNVERIAQDFANRIKQLKHLTPEEIRAEIDGLPDEEFHR